jgi:CubicO group peptidase (beta-lactamase class C family)
LLNVFSCLIIFQGYGIATFPSTPATPETLWMGASTTKAFTAAAMSFLVDDNENYSQIQWDTPISQIIRDDFVLEDVHITNHATIEDALSHRTGMPRHDLSYGGNVDGHKSTNRDVVHSLRHLPLTTQLRTKFQYCNTMYVVASYIIETVTGSSLDDVIRSRILKPLDMRSTYFDHKAARKAPEHFANGYYYCNGSYHEVPDMDVPDLSGAGFMISNVLDYTKWIRALIDQASPISESGHKALRKPHMLEETEPPYTGPMAYTLGWFTGVYQGYECVQHGGGLEAFGSNVIFFPELRYGLVAFGNIASFSNIAEVALQWHLIDEKLKIPKERRFDWNKK